MVEVMVSDNGSNLGALLHLFIDKRIFLGARFSCGPTLVVRPPHAPVLNGTGIGRIEISLPKIIILYLPTLLSSYTQ